MEAVYIDKHVALVEECRNGNRKAQYVSVNIGAVKGDALIKQQYGQGLNIGSVDNEGQAC